MCEVPRGGQPCSRALGAGSTEGRAESMEEEQLMETDLRTASRAKCIRAQFFSRYRMNPLGSY